MPGDIEQAGIQRELGKVEIGLGRQGDNPQFWVGQGIVLIALFERFGFSAANKGHDRREDFAVIRVAANGTHLLVDVLAEFEHTLYPTVDAENHLGPA